MSYFQVNHWIRKRSAWLAVALLVCGCQAGAPPESVETRLQLLSRLYLHAGVPRGVNDADHLRTLLEQLDDQQYAAFGLNRGRLADLFISPRDGQPFEIVYRVRPASPNEVEQPVIMAETQGADGRRLIAFADGRLLEVDALQVERLIRQGREAVR
jgi:hypothetical protein